MQLRRTFLTLAGLCSLSFTLNAAEPQVGSETVAMAQPVVVPPFCDSLCQGESVAALNCFDERYGRSAGVVDYAAARRACEQAAEAGDASAQTLLAELNFLGLGQAQDLARAVEWYAQAAQQGHPHARLMMYQLTRMGLSPSPTSAAEWLQLAREAGHPGLRMLPLG